MATLGEVWAALETLTDPEIPVLTLCEMGILRDVRDVRDVRQRAGAGAGWPALEVVITPTYSGCPAMAQIEEDVRATLAALRIDARVVVQLTPVWTSDWLSDTAKDKLRGYGIAPPNGRAPAGNTIQLRRDAARTLADTPVSCPRCGSSNTTETSPFGSTACKALFRCLACLEPFDHFKPH